MPGSRMRTNAEQTMSGSRALTNAELTMPGNNIVTNAKQTMPGSGEYNLSHKSVLEKQTVKTLKTYITLNMNSSVQMRPHN